MNWKATTMTNEQMYSLWGFSFFLGCLATYLLTA
jgi:hypothetical protein